jgi:hypothetical protein
MKPNKRAKGRRSKKREYIFKYLTLYSVSGEKRPWELSFSSRLSAVGGGRNSASRWYMAKTPTPRSDNILTITNNPSKGFPEEKNASVMGLICKLLTS